MRTILLTTAGYIEQCFLLVGLLTDFLMGTLLSPLLYLSLL